MSELEPSHPLPDRLPRLMLIDDDAISREVLALVLETRGFTVVAAEDGSEALDLIESAAPEVILMDTQMPGLSGLELVAGLRSRSKARVIAISGSEPGVEIREATDGFLLKPIDAEDLIALLEAARNEGGKLKSGRSSEEAGSSEVINPVVLGKLKAMMPAKAVREIYSAVATDLRTRLVTLQAAMEAGNLADVRSISHAIKGGCAMVGLSGAMEAAARLESSNVSVTLLVEPSPELSQLHFALNALEGMLGEDFPA